MRLTLQLSLSTVLALVCLTGSAQAKQGYQPRMGEMLQGLTTDEGRLFDHGREAFERPLTIPEGLGPIMNEISCAVCHSGPRTGGSSTTRVTRFGRAAAGGLPFDPLANLGGSLRQKQAIDPMCLEVVPPEADVVIERQTPICFGVGLTDAIDDADIIAGALNQPAHLMGFARMAQPLEDPNGPMRVARFGWKGGVPTVHSFSIDAALNEMGLTSPFLLTENAPNGDQGLLAQCDNVPEPEDQPGVLGLLMTEHFTNFQRLSAPPPQTPRSGMTGELVFNSIGCADCHVPTWTTSPNAPAGFANVEIHPYSDFLVHDMASLGDGIVDGDAGETDMMTRTLWGVRTRAALLHDGRAEGGTVEDNYRDAILAHDGEGAPSSAAFMGLSQADKDFLYQFLDSLGRAEFDFEGDDDVDFFDWFFIEPGFNGPTAAYTPDDIESINDIDADGDFDLRDYLITQRAFTGELASSSLQRVIPSRPVTELDVRVESGGAVEIWVASGASVPYQVVGETTGIKHKGLAGFSFDLAFDGGALTQAADPAAGAMLQFATPDGINNPGGFGGTVIGGDLIQVGGGQNTIDNSFAPVPVGTVLEGVAMPGSPEILIAGALTAPAAQGTYHLTLSDLRANVLAQSSTAADEFWRVDIAEPGANVGLIVHVLDCGTEAYCVAKVNSQGCSAATSSTGTPTLGGADDFHITADMAINESPGLLIWSFGAATTPAFGGTLCVAQPFVRTAFQSSGGTPYPAVDCTGTFDYHFTQAEMMSSGFSVGTTAFAQYWYRDPSHVDGTGAGFSDGLAFAICP